MLSRIFFLLFFVIFGLFHLIFGQNPRSFQYAEDQGLLTDEVYAVFLDNKGFVWLGSASGLYHFDGFRFKHYQSENQRDKSITGLCQSPNGRIYGFNFSRQIFYIENEKLHELNYPAQNIASLTWDHEILYVCYEGGILTYHEKTKKWSHFWKPDPDVYNLTKAFIKKNDDAYWLSVKGLHKKSGNNIQTFEIKDSLAKLFLPKAILIHWKDEIWCFYSEKYIYRLKNNVFEKITNKNFETWCLTTYQGVLFYNPINDQVRHFYKEISFSDTALDDEENIWLSSLNHGLLRIPDLEFTYFQTNLKSNVEKVRQVITDQHHVYFSNEAGIIQQLHKKNYKLKSYKTDKNVEIQSLAYHTIQNFVLFSIKNSIYQLNNEGLRLMDEYSSVKKILFVKNGLLYASSMGLCFTDLKNKMTLSSDWTRDLCSLDSDVYAATSKGLYIFEIKNEQWQKKDSLFYGKGIFSISTDNQNKTIYVLMANGIIQVLKKNKLTKTIQIPVKQVVSIKFEDNKIYVASSEGFWIYDEKSKNWTTYTIEDGLISNLIHNFTIDETHIYLATSKGLQRIPKNHQKKQTHSKIFIHKILNHDKLQEPQNIQLNYDDVLKVYLAVKAYRSEQKVNWMYRFSNQKDWNSIPGNAEFLSFSNFPDGSFTLFIKLIDAQGKDSINQIILKGYSNPPFWRNNWFWALMFFLGFLLILMYYFRRIQQLKWIQENEVNRLKLENQLSKTQQTALKAQMNPHFIFNVLNSIKSYIYKNDKTKASTYLSDFADLIRKYLDTSSLHEITIKDEVDMLKLYIQLESLMLEDFELELYVSPSIEQENIPPLLIQPFVENAFKHGLRNVKGPKKLTLEIKAQENNFQILIEDNGIGRVAAEKMKKKDHQSFALSAIQERINLINAEKKYQISYKYVDLLQDGRVLGTQVIIQISKNKHD